MGRATENNGNLKLSIILIKDAKLKSDKLSDDKGEVKNLINKTIEKQTEVLKLNKIDQNELRTVVQL